MPDQDEVFVCEHCGHPTSVASDTCPSCGEPMTDLAKPNPKKSTDSEGADLTDDEIAAGEDDGTVSLDALRAEEEDDEPEFVNE